MAKDQWDKVGELFEEAQEVPPGERAAYLEEACEEEAVRKEVLSLLEAEEGAGGADSGHRGLRADEIISMHSDYSTTAEVDARSS